MLTITDKKKEYGSFIFDPHKSFFPLENDLNCTTSNV